MFASLGIPLAALAGGLTSSLVVYVLAWRRAGRPLRHPSRPVRPPWQARCRRSALPSPSPAFLALVRSSSRTGAP
ncbi:hypothetical protein, partial [Pseudonocardia sp. NPDC046786]|uniref:hypothetical protein n=1 Tax=Pseudonocardia sp. NPDC046786 TaxID=3155471 RepID=UPI0033DCCDEA